MRHSSNQKEEDSVRILVETAESFNLDAHSWTSSRSSKWSMFHENVLCILLKSAPFLS